ncbi:RNA-dependent RNA polymerase [Venustampulla echinocandica]|uniref:RNA-dependent RNA polymerase n=1 Tax=Venustampulla echinocandica TaxID=2656787 RepID=A0A370T932_9HELO|nr:RNA-dependent RNA polymerase [Venustampulla echinocandica]RDL29987.1 RNA-dependent RNA polymerase [Venustampulla echinocandica]
MSLKPPTGMEVHVANVPPQSNEKALRNFLKPYLASLNITNFHCRKIRDKPFASLTFLNIDEGQRFLARHAQTRSAVRQKPPLTFYGRQIYFSKSYRDPDQFLLRTLAWEAQKRDTHAFSSYPERPPPSQFTPFELQCLNVLCGVWSPEGTEVGFVPQLGWNEDAVAVFGERVMILKLSSGLRIDFRYSSTLEITTEDGSVPAITFTMYEAPRFFENIQDPVAELLSKLDLSSHTARPPVSRRHGPTRHRLPSLNSEHRTIVGNCLVYRIILRRHQYTPFGLMMNVGESMQALANAPGIFIPVIHQRTPVRRPLEGYVVGLKRLHTALSALSCELPFVLKFQVQKLAQDGYLSPFLVLDLLPEFTNMARRSTPTVCVHTLRKFMNRIHFVRPETDIADFHLDTLIGLLQEIEEQSKKEVKFGYEESKTSENVAIIHRAKVTPTSVQLSGPEPESNNRVLRKYLNYHQYFLRVQFCDEDSQPVRFNSRISNEKILHGRFKEVLDTGIVIADRVYKFLGFSHSSLRAQSCWFVAPFYYEGSLLYDRMIIDDLGNFSAIRCPAKCAARIGQAFSDTRTAVKIDADALQIQLDTERNGRIFSDGVGTMSTSMMEKIWEQLPKKNLPKPTCLQIRFQGAKGMISLDPRLPPGDALVLRPSMIKFEGSDSMDIEICEAAYKPLPMYLNRQFIKILEDMGVEDDFFLDLQEKEVQRLRIITDNPLNAEKFLSCQSIGETVHLPWFIAELAMLDLDFRSDRFLRDTAELAILIELRKLKHKTRIPVEKGYHLHGLMDETGFLEEGQVFCVVTEDETPKYITGANLIVSRAPALHPGDVQLVEGIMPPKDSALMSLTNCICFSQKGSRDLPSQLSGGDLDGDRYYIMWDERAKPKTRYTPADYPRQSPVNIDRTVNRSDMTEFFIQFMETDQLGRIAVMHRVLADQKPEGTREPNCIILAEMHSTAVDFSKTGMPVDMSRLPWCSPWRPDFEAPGPHVSIEKADGISFEPTGFRDPLEEEDNDDEYARYRYYESHKILGKLYRAIDEREIFDQIQKRAQPQGTDSRPSLMDEVWKYVQNKVRNIQWEYLKVWASDIRDMYEDCVMSIMVEYGQHPSRPLSELEVFVGDILGKTGVQNRHQREQSKTMKERFEEDTTFIVNCILRDGEEWSDEALARSIACLAVSLTDTGSSKRRENLLSFKYVAAAICLREVQKLPGWEALPLLDIFEDHRRLRE